MTTIPQMAALELDEGNIVDYLRARTDILDPVGSVDVRQVTGTPESPEEEGFVNFVHRVRQNGKSYIVKQSRPYLRHAGISAALPADRNYLEFLSFTLRGGIDDQTVPQMHFVDPDNNVFVMEDLLSLGMRPLRYQLNDGIEFPRFSSQIGAFLARNHFFTSELFLDKDVFRKMQAEFANPSMRAVMEDLVLAQPVLEDDSPIAYLGTRAWQDPALRRELVKTRDTLIRKGECLIHGDLHTSNIFIDATHTRIIDMEYSFVGPFSYDLGYLLANFVSQYAAFEFKSAVPRRRRELFQRYLLHTIKGVLDRYFECFTSHFELRAKPIYRETRGYLTDYLFPDILREALGFLSAANLHRISSLVEFPDFDSIADPKDRVLAQGLSAAIDEYLLRHRDSLATSDQVVLGIAEVREAYVATIAPGRVDT